MSLPRRLTGKIKSVRSLATLLKRARGRSSRFVFTNGCFDILHPGHVAYLEQARRMGTHLIVALNSDASVRRIKGPKRPINELADRLQVLAALESVDYVTWFEEDTPLAAILALKPDLLVKGGDWTPDQIVGSREIKAWGGKTRSLKFIAGRSTTRIIEKARASAGKAGK